MDGWLLFTEWRVTAKKNDMYEMGAMGDGGTGIISTPGSSGQNSPVSEQNSPPAYYRNTASIILIIHRLEIYLWNVFLILGLNFKLPGEARTCWPKV